MPDKVSGLRTNGSYRYLDEGPSSPLPPVLLLHGMLGDLGNWTHTVGALKAANYRVLAPILPVYDLPLTDTSVSGLVRYVRGFLEAVGVTAPIMVGNSLGGHVALSYAALYPGEIPAMVLSGASGIYEVNIGTSTPRRQDRNFIRDRAAVTFYDPVHVTDELVDEMYDIVNDRTRVIRLIKMARAAKAETVTDALAQIRVPTLLVWGRDDQITPPDVAVEFQQRLPHAELCFIDRCGHAPMMERPDEFNRVTLDFLARTVRVRAEGLAL